MGAQMVARSRVEDLDVAATARPRRPFWRARFSKRGVKTVAAGANPMA